MSKLPSLREFNVVFKDGQLKRNGRIINDEKLTQEILNKYKDITYSEVQSIINGWKIDAETQAEFDVDVYIKEQVVASGIIDNFFIVSDGQNAKLQQILHYKKEDEIKLIGALPIVDKLLVQVFRMYEPEKFSQLRQILSPILKPKLSITLDDTQLVEIIMNATEFYTNKSKTVELSSQIKPISIIPGILSYRKLNFIYTETPKLNTYLADFLKRTTNHETLCSILWLMFNGVKTPYIVYMYGSGGEGKSSFINMLCRLVKLYASFELEGLHRYYHMFGKSLIVLAENTDCFLLQNRAIKEITGNSPVSCQEKNQTSFTATIDGLFVVDSNLKPKLVGEEYEFRRLRFFETSAADFSQVKKLSQEDYVAALGSTPDDFISYCRKCYEKVGGNNMVEAPDSMISQHQKLIDSYSIFQYNKVLSKMKLQIGGNKKISLDRFFHLYDTKVVGHKDRYFLDNLKTFLRLYKNVVEIGNEFIGLGEISNEKEGFDF